jgi:hypothetical protein
VVPTLWCPHDDCLESVHGFDTLEELTLHILTHAVVTWGSHIDFVTRCQGDHAISIVKLKPYGRVGGFDDGFCTGGFDDGFCTGGCRKRMFKRGGGGYIH